MVERIACFLTCGYTEAGAMQFFLRKMNDKYEYKQYLPNKTIKKKGDAKRLIPEISGLTGEALLEKVYKILEKNKDEKVLKEYSKNIEEYGWFEDGYVKLSNRIFSAIQTEVKDYIGKLQGVNSAYVKELIESKDLYYSKKLHGDIMLRNIQPDIVAGKCRRYFAGTYNQIAYIKR